MRVTTKASRMIQGSPEKSFVTQLSGDVQAMMLSFTKQKLEWAEKVDGKWRTIIHTDALERVPGFEA